MEKTKTVVIKLGDGEICIGGGLVVDEDGKAKEPKCGTIMFSKLKVPHAINEDIAEEKVKDSEVLVIIKIGNIASLKVLEEAIFTTKQRMQGKIT